MPDLEEKRIVAKTNNGNGHDEEYRVRDLRVSVGNVYRGELNMTMYSERFRKKSAKLRAPGMKSTISCSCLTLSRIQSKRISMLLDFLARTVSLARPTAHSLSQNTTVGGWGYPRLARQLRSSTAIWALLNTPAYSDSETAAHTTGIPVLLQ